ncbi:TMV resistance protein N-like [Syzygium oleosum]|uniref:TMV resistance protein N-like n=1 Tax=Syzygium oleosum TaxID=219896 RepID=UPI0024B9DB48|nr:TMV resistance protein N-like [Syzygium oleosum]
MASRAKALTATLLAVVFLSLTMAPTWSMAFLILFGMIAPAVVAAGKKMRRNPALAADAPALDVDALALDVDALAVEVDAAGKMRRKPESSSSSSGIEYDLYLSFRDTDAHEFVSHLYTELDRAGIRVFIDSEGLRKGEEIGFKLKEEIKRSRICIAVLSPNFASSKFCLDELLQMWEFRELNGHTIIPIFYEVSSSDVKHQAGDFGRSFDRYEKLGVDLNTIETWRKVLRQIGSMKASSIAAKPNGDEGQLAEEVARVVHVLKKGDQVITDKLVGIDDHVEKMMKILGFAYRKGQATEERGGDVRILGIWGMPGIGKTTLAKVVFNKMRKLFDASSFLEDISLEGVEFSRRKLIVDLQKQKPAPVESSGEGIEEIASLCRNAKVLIVLDNICESQPIKALTGNLTWLSPGSRIIVTTNKRNVLNALAFGALDRWTVFTYEVGDMRDDHAHKLFCKYAFRGAAAQDVSEYFGLSMDIAKAIGGLPSSIVDHASSLRDNMNIHTWKSTLGLLKKKTQKI